MEIYPNEDLPTGLKRFLIHILKLLMYISEEIMTNSRKSTTNNSRIPKTLTWASKVISSTFMFSFQFANVLVHYISMTRTSF